MRFPLLRKGAGAVFVHPLDPAPKTVVLAAGFQNSRAIRTFPEGWGEEASRLGPCSVAGPVEDLLRLAEAGVELRHAVIVLTRGPASELSEKDRDTIWNAFGVPVFEQCLGPNNDLLAAECEAHDGLHVMGAAAGRALEAGICGCGSSIPRLKPVQKQQSSRVRELLSA